MANDRITVKDAAVAINRHISRVYAWIHEERLTVWENDSGVTYLSLAEVRELDARMFRRRNNRKTHHQPA
ncbi:hypothetical protein KPL76_06240 [Subtercola sp. PAMC28395]|uniref:hypothetical protein n=1 Tax=Subtercola sp. PAMC28395 TaxID=2846775 RepID=UPI001C0E7C80|nr:hypothetical protein [Subtercola sp. PAMC28395]QWT24953.1 hypothetical protein KPL76_06240 [Subtercola sp. PAMC28395]